MPNTLAEVRQHLRDLAPHVKQRKTPQLLVKMVAEIEQLRECEEIKLVEFLSRPDVLVFATADHQIVVHDRCGDFEGHADNVISAARMAIQMERKAAEAEGK